MVRLKDGIDYYIKTHKDFKNKFTNEQRNNLYVSANIFFHEMDNYLENAKISDEHMDELKKYLYDKYIIKDVPNSYIYYEKEHMKTLGYKYEGERFIWSRELEKLKFPTEKRKQVLLLIQKDQMNSLEEWIDFLVYANFPVWFRYFVFTESMKIGSYYEFICSFTKRSSSTTDSFINVDYSVIQKMYEMVENYILHNDNSSDLPSFKQMYIFIKSSQKAK